MMSAVPDLVGNELGLLFSTVTCTLAAVLVFIGALKGFFAHRFPRLLLAAATTTIAGSYWLEVFTDIASVTQIRRGAGWVLWPALAWTAWSGISYQRKRAAETEAIRREREHGTI